MNATDAYIRLTEAASILIIDVRTLARACRDAGVSIRGFGPRTRRIAREDFERIKREGITLYGDKQSCNNHS